MEKEKNHTDNGVKLTLPWPPSVNHLYVQRRKGRALSKDGKAYILAVKSAVVAAKQPGLPIAGDLHVRVALHPPDNRRRDVDNYSKALFDSLTKAGVWGDDSQIKHTVCFFADKSDQPRVEMEIAKC